MKNPTVPMLLTLAVSTVAWAQRSSRHEVADPVATLVTTATPIVCATYNIRMNTPSDGDNAWPNRARRVRELIRFHEWDIFGTQEGFKGQLDDLAQMEEYSYIGVGRDDGAEAGEHSAIFYRRERFELLDKGDFWLSETPEKPSLGWDAPSNVRICSWGRFRDRATGREFCMFCAHYDHIGVRAREESSKLVLRRIAEIADGVPTIFVGDLNSTPDSGAVTVLEGAMNDARKVTQQPPYGPVGTFGGFVAGARVLADRIDYIFVSPGISVLKYGVLTDYVDNRLSSDHLPVVAKLVIND